MVLKMERMRDDGEGFKEIQEGTGKGKEGLGG